MTGVGTYTATDRGQSVTLDMIPRFVRLHLDSGAAPYTKAEYGAIDIFGLTVEYYSTAEKAECAFKRTGGFSTELDKAAQKVLSVGASDDNLVNGFRANLNCNNLPTIW